jgi:hypothetical protein
MPSSALAALQWRPTRLLRPQDSPRDLEQKGFELGAGLFYLIENWLRLPLRPKHLQEHFQEKCQNFRKNAKMPASAMEHQDVYDRLRGLRVESVFHLHPKM